MVVKNSLVIVLRFFLFWKIEILFVGFWVFVWGCLLFVFWGIVEIGVKLFLYGNNVNGVKVLGGFDILIFWDYFWRSIW